MDGVTSMKQRERIAYRRGFNDGLSVMRDRIQDLLSGTEPPISGEDLAAWLCQCGPFAPFAPVAHGDNEWSPLGPDRWTRPA